MNYPEILPLTRYFVSFEVEGKHQRKNRNYGY